ncbi:MAG TPA: DMT family transporter [Kribbella sp.]|nr:DMT family transporter [Kribbella sp.]
MILVIVLALSAALLNARAAFMQRQGIRATLDAGETRDAIQIARNLPALVRQPRWMWGWFTDLGGFGCQAAALHFGSVALVQPLLTTQLLFTLAIVSWHRQVMPRPLAWLGAASICGGLVLLIVVQGDALAGDPDRTKVLLATLAAAVSVAVLVAASRVARRGAVLSAIAAGLCFAMSAVYMKLTTEDLLTVGVAGTARDWPGYFLAAATFAGLLTMQVGFAGERLTWSVAAMNITNPVAGYLVGIFAFDVSVPTDRASLAGIAGAGLLLIVGVVALSNVPALAEQVRTPAARARRRS